MNDSIGGLIATRRFATVDQERFAALSGDRNPLHMDPLVARRTPLGRPVVHGMHVLLWCLDRLCARPRAVRPGGLKVDFLQPCLVGDEVSLRVVGEQRLGLAVQALVGRVVAVQMILLAAPPKLSESAFHCPLPAAQAPALSATPQPLDFDAMDGRLGEFRPMVDGFADAFPEASRVLGAPSVAGIAALSTVVGMECPGLYSLFASATLAFSDDVETAVRYRAERLFAAVRQVVLRVRAPGIEASLRAGARHPPLAQPGTAQVRSVVEPDEFAGRRALIVGGSRGLGELTARIIAAGAGRPVITYASGAADAASVSDEIRGGGGQCETLRYDALTPAEPQLAALTIVPTSVYYFATGPIFLRKQALYEPELASDFHRLYVDGFYALLSALRARSSAPLAVFYPSSIAVESLARDLAEYAAAKAAGEMLCKHLAAFLPDTRITVSRLPRIATDQTATLVPVHTEDALVTMLPIVREVETPML